jgi:hypothetical protein
MFPILFHIGSFVVHTYGIVLMAAFLVALGRAYTVAKRQNDPDLPPDSILDVGIWMIAVGVIGARLLFVVIGWKDYHNAPDFPGNIFKVWEGGLSFHAGRLLFDQAPVHSQSCGLIRAVRYDCLCHRARRLLFEWLLLRSADQHALGCAILR